MNAPQLENGYTRIANDIVEALAKKHPGFTEGQVLWSVIRKTYGWNKKSDKISISQLVEMTGKSRRMVIYAIQNLEAKNMLFVSRSFQQVNEISFNKNYSEWVKGAKSNQYQKLHLVQKVAPSATNGKELVQHSVNDVPKVAPTKETITKETIQKKGEHTLNSVLEKLTDDDVDGFAKKYNIRKSDVRDAWETMVTSCFSRNKRYANWKLALNNWIKPMIKEGKINKKTGNEIEIAED